MDNTNAIKLIKELKANKFLPKYNDQGVHDVCNEIKQEFIKIHDMMQSEGFDRDDPSQVAQMIVANHHMRENLRCGLAYLNARLEKLQKLGWESGKSMPEHLKEKLSPLELQFYQSYLENLDEYNKSLSDLNNLDLTIDLTPPKELYIEVKVLRDYGTIILPESGQIVMKKGTTQYVRRSEIEPLVKQGIVSEV